MNDSRENPTSTPFRILAAVAGLLLAAYGLFNLLTWGPRVSIRGLTNPLVVGPAVAAGMSWWFAARGHVPEVRARIGLGCRGGLIGAAVGFGVGFVGPLVVIPQSNVGPVLSVFFAAAGFVLGTLLGLAVPSLRRFKTGGGHELK